MPDSPTEDRPLIGSATEAHPLDNFLWWIFHGIRFVAVVASIAMMVAQILTVVVLEEGIFQDILRIYVVVFCICFILAELDLLQRKIPFLVGWIYRGVMYSFIGVIGVEEANTVKISENKKTHKVAVSFVGRMSGTYVWIVSVSMFAVGLIYVIMGVICLRKVHDRIIRRRAVEENEEAQE